MTEQEVEILLTQTKAIMKGHFLLTSGLHSDTYVEKFQLLQYPQYTSQLCEELAKRFQDDKIDVVIGPAVGGIIIAHEVAKALGTRFIFTEREENGIMTLRRGFEINPGERVLVVEDIVTTGGSVQEVLNVVLAHGGALAGVGLLVDRSDGQVKFGNLKTEALLHLSIPTHKANDCPLCHYEMPITKRGSRKTR